LFYSDKPITRPGEDRLGRAGFARELAKSIDKLSVAQDGFVIALLGEWGSGKTSVIELIIRYLRHIEMSRTSEATLWGEPAPVPVSVDDLESMAEPFETVERHVRALAIQNRDITRWQLAHHRADFERWLGDASSAEQADRYWRLLRSVELGLNGAEKHNRTIVVRFSPWVISGRAEMAIALLSELARGLGEGFDDAKRAFADVLKRLAELAPVAGAAIDVAVGGVVGQLVSVGTQLSARAASKMVIGPTLDELRQRLRVVLASLYRQRVLVIVDDLDRLLPAEALEVVSLIKSLGDLPNVIYLLSYEETQLGKLIGAAGHPEGEAFLEKIVQYPIHLPPAEETDLISLLDADLVSLLGEVSDDDKRRLGLTWRFVYRHYLKSPRDIRRYVNSLAVSLPVLRDFVNPIDLAMLELLRLYDSKVYWWVRQNLNDITRP
jgi:predicted KAP-like P-loop ATPase